MQPKEKSISIHALREEGDETLIAVCNTPDTISIHALREEGDGSTAHNRPVFAISIHALREEGDDFFPRQFAARQQFLSTPSARRATRYQRHRFQLGSISIHALREEGDGFEFVRESGQFIISIHALREEGDWS